MHKKRLGLIFAFAVTLFGGVSLANTSTPAKEKPLPTTSSETGHSIFTIQDDEDIPVGKLTVVGVNHDGIVTSDLRSLNYTFDAEHKFIAEESSIYLSTPSHGRDVTSWFQIDGERGTLNLKPNHINDFINVVHDSTYAGMVFTLATDDVERNYGFEQLFYWGKTPQ